ncbi:DoxX family membrane protein [Cohnella silvisoli]|uniref:DoxX family membrane protein n=1 Tax=Cohnella silvisoli TaxID=2873699 RepID=A0ABV1L165_9BACL|nr:DoxX family membrane protein [Cohnella silvisoli]MCD9025532.1 DoxX family membrane protein [Cohnella silvisoli]
MVMRWFKENVWAAVAVTLLRIYVGWQWIDAGWHKLTGGFDASGFLKGAVGKPVADHATKEVLFPNYTYFLNHFALPNVKLINILIPCGEFLIGLGLILGGLTLTAAFFGMLLNFMFLMAGTVSTNPWLLMLGVIVFTAGANARRFGLDAYLLPLLRKGWTKLTNRTDHTKTDNNINGKVLPH